MVGLEKCKKCNKLGLSCCNFPPLWKEEELAKFHFETDILEKLENSVKISYLREYNGYVITKKEDVKGDSVILTNPCVFFNSEEGICTIYDYRPGYCRDKGTEKDPCIFSNIPIEEMDESKIDSNIRAKLALTMIGNKPVEVKAVNFKLPTIKKFSKKHLKNMKEDMLLYLILNSFNNLRDNWSDNGYIKFTYKYGLVLVETSKSKAMSSVRHTIASTEIPELKPLTLVYNKLHRRFVLRDPIYVDMLVKKLQRIIKGVSFVETGLTDRDFLSYIGSFIPLLDMHKTYFKNKTVKGLITDEEFYMAKKWLYKYCGSDSLLKIPEIISKLYKNAEMVYKAIMKQK